MGGIAKIFNTLGSNVVTQARANLKKKKKGNSNLSKNLSYKVKRSSIEFTLADYWEYVDAGVKGVGGKRADKKVKGKKVTGAAWKLKKVTNNKFKYRNKKPPFMAFNGWTIRKGIAPRNKKGQFGSYKTMGFILANSIKQKGIPANFFFSKALDKGLESLPQEYVKAIVRDNLTLTKK